MLGLLAVVGLLLVVMPMLIYLTVAGIVKYTRQAPSWIGFPVDSDRAREIAAKAGTIAE